MSFKILTELVAEGMATDYEDAYWQMVDMGEMQTSDYMIRKCRKADSDKKQKSAHSQR